MSICQLNCNPDQGPGRRRRGAEAAGGGGKGYLAGCVPGVPAQGRSHGQTERVKRGAGQQAQVHC